MRKKEKSIKERAIELSDCRKCPLPKCLNQTEDRKVCVKYISDFLRREIKDAEREKEFQEHFAE